MTAVTFSYRLPTYVPTAVLTAHRLPSCPPQRQPSSYPSVHIRGVNRHVADKVRKDRGRTRWLNSGFNGMVKIAGNYLMYQ